MESLQAGETVTLTTVCTVKASDDKKDDENKENLLEMTKRIRQIMKSQEMET